MSILISGEQGTLFYEVDPRTRQASLIVPPEEALRQVELMGQMVRTSEPGDILWAGVAGHPLVVQTGLRIARDLLDPVKVQTALLSGLRKNQQLDPDEKRRTIDLVQRELDGLLAVASTNV